jgi:hypothetical protein
MAKIERVRETWSRPITAEYLAQQASFGWKLVSVVWEREIEPDPNDPSPREEDPPYGLRALRTASISRRIPPSSKSCW